MMKEAMHRLCVECGEQMTLKTISRTFNIRGKEIEIRGIKAYVCEKCGEIVYTSAEAKMIERVIGAIKESPQEEISVLNLTETAEYLRVSNQTVYNMIKAGRIKAYKVGREWRFLRSDILAYLNTSASESLLAAKGGTSSEHDMKIIRQEIVKRKKPK